MSTDIKHSPVDCIPQREWSKLSVKCRKDFKAWLDTVEVITEAIEEKVDDRNLQLKDPFELARMLILACEPDGVGGMVAHPVVVAHAWIAQAEKNLGLNQGE